MPRSPRPTHPQSAPAVARTLAGCLTALALGVCAPISYVVWSQSQHPVVDAGLGAGGLLLVVPFVVVILAVGVRAALSRLPRQVAAALTVASLAELALAWAPPAVGDAGVLAVFVAVLLLTPRSAAARWLWPTPAELEARAASRATR